jgi:hypothetical protein
MTTVEFILASGQKLKVDFTAPFKQLSEDFEAPMSVRGWMRSGTVVINFGEVAAFYEVVPQSK